MSQTGDRDLGRIIKPNSSGASGVTVAGGSGVGPGGSGRAGVGLNSSRGSGGPSHGGVGSHLLRALSFWLATRRLLAREPGRLQACPGGLLERRCPFLRGLSELVRRLHRPGPLVLDVLDRLQDRIKGSAGVGQFWKAWETREPCASRPWSFGRHATSWAVRPQRLKSHPQGRALPRSAERSSLGPPARLACSDQTDLAHSG